MAVFACWVMGIAHIGAGSDRFEMSGFAIAGDACSRLGAGFTHLFVEWRLFGIVLFLAPAVTAYASLTAQEGGLTGLAHHFLGLFLGAAALVLNTVLQLAVQGIECLVGQEKPEYEDDQINRKHAILTKKS